MYNFNISRDSVEDRYEDHGCQTDDTHTETSGNEDGNPCDIKPHDAEPIIKTVKKFEDLGVQTEPGFNEEEIFGRPILNSSMDLDDREETTVAGSLNTTADLNHIDSILEKNDETIESMKTNFIKEYLNKTTNIGAEDFLLEDDSDMIRQATLISEKGRDFILTLSYFRNSH